MSVRMCMCMCASAQHKTVLLHYRHHFGRSFVVCKLSVDMLGAGVMTCLLQQQQHTGNPWPQQLFLFVLSVCIWMLHDAHLDTPRDSCQAVWFASVGRRCTALQGCRAVHCGGHRQALGNIVCVIGVGHQPSNGCADWYFASRPKPIHAASQTNPLPAAYKTCFWSVCRMFDHSALCSSGGAGLACILQSLVYCTWRDTPAKAPMHRARSDNSSIKQLL